MLLELRLAVFMFQLQHIKHPWKQSMGANTWSTFSARKISLWKFGCVQTQRGENHRPQMGTQGRMGRVRRLQNQSRLHVEKRVLGMEIERIPKIGSPSHQYQAQSKRCWISAHDKVRRVSGNRPFISTHSRL